MKQAVLFFRMKDSFVDLKKVNDTIDLLCGSHFSPTQITFLPCEDRKEFFDVFTALSETTDNILVFENENNDFELSEVVQGYDRLNYIYEKGKKSVLFVADNQKANSVVEDLWIPHLQKKYDTSYGKVTFKVFGLKRKEILAATGRIEKETGVGFVVYGEGLDYKVQLVYDNVELNERLVDLLNLRRCVLSVAESFTGGRVAASVVAVPGASEVFYDGIVSYDQDAKNRLLGVDTSTLAKYKPVSAQVACEMAQGLYASGKANLVLSTTGIAGPKSDDSGFPVGLCFIGVGFNGKIGAYRFEFKGSRSEIIENGTKMALFLAIMTIKEL